MSDGVQVDGRLRGMVLCIVPAIALLIGCGPKVPANPTTEPVHGTVKYKGEAVTKGFICFSPVDPAQGRAAEGAIKEDGSYELRAFVGQQGTLPGEYKVWFSALPEAARGESVTDPLPIPKKYQSAETTDITQTVSSGDNTIDVDIPAAEEGESDDAKETEE
jgi:hypothetical protein